ncbi:MAG: hypothetical protein LCH84_18690 [Gemmatimonadetes bacterium]|nr:hypothetical protein [Gemmatimonadota bacterium]
MPSGSTLRAAHRCAAFLFALALLHPARLDAQAAPRVGRIVALAISPTFPDVVAVERRVAADAQELELRRLSAAGSTPVRRTPALLATPLVPAGSHDPPVRRYSGDLDWRPVVGGDAHWFAYVSGEPDGLHVRINYVQGDGTLGMTTPLALPGDPRSSAPRWSPDGRHLTFVSDSGTLVIAADVDRLLRGDALPPQLTRVTAAGVAVRAPAWSPRGGFIAFESERTVRGALRHVIDVVAVDRITGTPLGIPVTVAALVTENAFRPSWSPDDAFVAFYVDQGSGDDVTPGIGVAELLRDANTGALIGGEVKQGRRSRRLAEAVQANESRGPLWTRFEGEAISGGRRPLPGLVFAAHDPARGQPVSFVTLERWLDNRTAAEVSTELSAPWDSREHTALSIVEGAQRLRIAYAVPQPTGDVLRTRELLAEWAIAGVPIDDASPRRVAETPSAAAADRATSPERGNTRNARSTNADTARDPGSDDRAVAVRSAAGRGRSFGGHLVDLFPAYMQMRQGRPLSAFLVLGAGAAAGLYMATGMNFPEGKSRPWAFEIDSTNTNAIVGLAAGSTVWLLGQLDGWRVDRQRARVGFSMAPVVQPGRGMGAVAHLRIAYR